MENQFIQVKTQVAVAIADQHVLAKKGKEQEEKAAEFKRKAELAVDKGQDDLARAALEKLVNIEKMGTIYRQQESDQHIQAENLKSVLSKLEQKLDEARTKRDLLIAQHRRAKALGKASDAQLQVGSQSKSATFDRLQDRVVHAEAISQAKAELLAEDVDDRLHRLEKTDQVERLLAEMKDRRRLNP
jgi:phage shock protein A